MTSPTSSTGFYGDFNALSVLKKDARTNNPQALRQAAQQFESLFTEMMLKSMRAAHFGDSLTSSDEVEFYQGMFDQQLSLQMSKGKGMGLADMLVQQLARSGLAAKSDDPAAVQPKAIPVTNQDDKSEVRVPAIQPDKSSSASSSKEPVSSTSMLSSASPEDFVRCVWPHAQSAAQRLGVDPAMLVAHAALETGWGKHVPSNEDGSSSLNLFGIKASGAWQGNSATNATLEYVEGKPVQQMASFKSYSSMSDCFADYARMLGNDPRYQGVRNAGSNGTQFAHTLQSGGYATDPAYSDKLQSVMRSVSSLLGRAGS